MPQSLHNRLLLGLSFLEGGSLMATELLSARMLAPYFGSSLFVWATVLALTLGGLTVGYFLGGNLSLSERKDKILLITLLYSGVIIMLMPFTAQWVLNFAHHLAFRDSVITSALIIIIPPVVGMGMVSPLMVANLDESAETSGKRAGLVYAISTSGGITFTFLFGFYIIPNFGLIFPSIITGFILGIVPAILVFKNGWKKPGIFFLVFALAGGYFIRQKSLESGIIDVLYQKEGILGQVMVADIPVMHHDSIQKERTLFVNRVIQTSYNLKNQRYNDHAYFNVSEDVIGKFPEGSDMLLLGLGGGVLASDAIKKGFRVDAVELDQRIIEVAREYFGLPDQVKVFRDDARRFINATNKKYDLIVFDLFRGEETPAHVFTAESMSKARKMLKPGGLALINSNGYYRGEIGKGNRSLYKTIRAMGLFTEIYLTDSLEEKSNSVFVFSNSMDAFEDKVPVYMQKRFVPKDSIDIADAIILTDRRPVLDYLNEDATRVWRMGYMAYMRSFYTDYRIPLFN
ncbi:MAG: fused MFS/spermidine synthase [Bacteroidetes bacterium]|nr:fused MFS/spermidine synthase [Bacteroidota bacterium]